jgi:hypothetical protein
MAYPRRTRDMPVQPRLRRSPVLAAVLAAAGIVLTVASCSNLAPLGPDQSPAAAPSQAPAMPVTPSHLGSPIILQVMRSQPATAAGGCPAGYVALSAPNSAGTCYRKLGTPVTITSAAVSSVFAHGQPASYGFIVAVPADNVAAVTAVIKQAYDARGALAVNVDGKIWSAPQVLQPFPGQQLQIALPSRKQALQLYRILVSAS